MPGALDSQAEGALVLGANSALAARLNFGPVRYEPAQLLEVLIVNSLDVVHAKGADPPPGGVTASEAVHRAGGRRRAGDLGTGRVGENLDCPGILGSLRALPGPAPAAEPAAAPRVLPVRVQVSSCLCFSSASYCALVIALGSAG